MNGDFSWTDDFPTFKSKVESIFGPIEGLAETAPDLYAHQVVAHGFMEFALVRRIEKEDLRVAFDEWYDVNGLAPALKEEGWEEYCDD